MRYAATCCRHGEGWLMAKADKERQIDRDRIGAKRARIRIRRLFAQHFRNAAKKAAEELARLLPLRRKDDSARVAGIIRELKLEDDEELRVILAELLASIAREAVALGFGQLGANVTDAMLTLANQKAEAWAREHAAALVRGIDETTRERLRGLVAEAETSGWTVDELAQRIRDAYAFSPERAELIANTEMAAADVAGNMIAYRESGRVAGKRWILANQGDEKCCDECEEAADMGTIPLDDDFGDGVDAPPMHPNCRCDLIPVLAEPVND